MKKLLFLIFGLIIMLSVSVESHATSASHSHPICGSSCDCYSDHSSKSWTAWDGTTKMYNGYYYLTKDVELSSTMILDYSYTSYLCLNGHSITCEDTVFDIYSYRSLTVSDCKGTGKIESTNADCTIGNNKSLTVWGGTVVNSTDAYVRAINAYSGTVTYIYGGRVEGTESLGIYAYPGCKIYVYGGEVYGYNSAIDGHSDSKTFTGLISITGGRLSNAPYRGDVINFGSGNFSMTGGYIGGSVSVWAEPVTVKISGGTITDSLWSDADNTTVQGGNIGGLYMYGKYASVTAGAFSGTSQFDATETTVSGGNFTNAEHISVTNKTWICGGRFDNIRVNGSLYLSGVPEIDTITLLAPGKVYAQNPDSSGNFGGDTVKIALDSHYSDYEWKDGDVLIKNVNSDAVANKFVLAEESDYKSLVCSYNNLVLDILPNGTWGSNVTWYVDADGTLYISGTGAIDYTHSGSQYPWYKYVNDIKHIVVEEGITAIPQYAFEYLEQTETITLPETLLSLSLNAFNDCGSLNNIILPSSLRSITGTSITGHPEFIRCESLTDAYYLGTEEELCAATGGEPVTSYSSDMTLHFLQFNEGTATCTEAGTLPYYRFDDTSLYDGYYDEDKKLMSGLPQSPALGHRILALQEILVDPVTVNSESFELVNGVYYSANKDHGTSSLLSITADYDCTLTLSYGVSSEENYDKLIIAHNNTQKAFISGNVSNKTMSLNLASGDVVTVSYIKDNIVSIGEDRGWVHLGYDKVLGMGYADAPAENGEADCTNGVVCRYCQAVVKEPLGHRVIGQVESLVDPLVINNTTFSLSGNRYYSQNRTHSSSSQFTITAQFACTLNLNYGVSSESNYDKLIIKHNSTQKDAISGNVSDKTMTLNLASGDVVTVSYTKDHSVSSGNDTGWVALEYDKVTATVEGDVPADSVEAECGTVVTCHYCQTVVFDGTQHRYTSVATAPTCIAQGYTTYTCVCGDSYVDDYTDTINHEYTSEVTTPATHLAEGVETYTCACGDTYTETIARLEGHTYEKAVTAPTCTEKGYTTYTCACGDSYVGDYVDTKAHSFTDYIPDNNATYLADGTKTARCDNCNSTDTVAVEGSKLILGKTESITVAQNTSAIKLTWTAVADADGYRVYQMIDGKWVALGNTTKLSATVSGLEAGTLYSFAVKAGKKVDGVTVWAKNYTTVNTATKAAAPSGVSALQNTSEIRLDWESVDDVTGFRIYYKSGNSWKICVSSTSSTSHTFKNLRAGAKYTFAVRPYIKIDAVVIWGDYTEFTTATKPATVSVAATSPSKGKITLTWNAANGADGYQVYYKTGDGSYKLYKTYTSVQNLTFSSLQSGTKYTFAVRAGIKTSGGNIFGAYTPVTVTVK